MALGRVEYLATGQPTTRGGRAALGGPRRLAPIDRDASYSGTTAGSRIRRAAPAPETLEYAHKAGQNLVLWGGLIVFLVLLARRRSRAPMLRALARRHVA